MRRSILRRLLVAGLSVLMLTGGAGLAVPEIVALRSCGDYLFSRLLICAAMAILLSALAVVGGRSAGLIGPVALGVFLTSTSINLALGQDPLGAWLNWVAPHIRYETLTPGTETDGLYFIGNHEWMTYDREGRCYRAGHGA